MLASFSVRIALCVLLIGCGTPPVPEKPHAIALPSSDEDCGAEPYQAHAAWEGGKPALPVPPALPDTPKKMGDAYTVYGAIHELHMNPNALAKDVTIVGVIVDSNVTRAPKCALHKTGKADPPGCVTEIPTFRIADKAGDAISIPVMGWASNFPNVFEAYTASRKAKPTPWDDELWAVRVPIPLPAPGAKVKVTGRYGFAFTKSSTGVSTEPRTGIMTLTGIDLLEPSPTPISL